MTINRCCLRFEDDDAPEQMGNQQQMLVLAHRAHATHEFQHKVGAAVPSRIVNGENKLIVSAPTIDVRGVLRRDKLPPHVREDDEFGVLQTIFEVSCRAWYEYIPGLTVHATSIRDLSVQAKVRARTRPRSGSAPGPASNPREPVPYRAYSFSVLDLPAPDRGAHPYFYGDGANFQNDNVRQSLFGGGAVSERLGLAETDKPQHPFPLRTPIGIDGSFGIIDGYSYDFHACWWLVAMRAGIVVEYFQHLEWRFRDHSPVQRQGLDVIPGAGSGATTILHAGPGKGARNPAMGGLPADQRRTATEWSTPWTDPLGLR